ncbi:hypothetical protein [Oceanibaculum nanhaiense]|uniref:hypothetical protein n=1 Tax=Oceanibaculum nanhaiense TaxID=1909734 RepID=UPI003D273140
MKQISVSTDVFAKIWAERLPGEETESDILSRLLSERPSEPLRAIRPWPSKKETWRELIAIALSELGGSAHLSQIYKKTEELAVSRKRELPKSFEAIVRKEIESNSSDSQYYQGRYDLFRSIDGIGSGNWSLR